MTERVAAVAHEPLQRLYDTHWESTVVYDHHLGSRGAVRPSSRYDRTHTALEIRGSVAGAHRDGQGRRLDPHDAGTRNGCRSRIVCSPRRETAKSYGRIARNNVSLQPGRSLSCSSTINRLTRPSQLSQPV